MLIFFLGFLKQMADRILGHAFIQFLEGGSGIFIQSLNLAEIGFKFFLEDFLFLGDFISLGFV